MAKSDGCDYFKRTSLFWIVLVTFGVGHFSCMVFIPEKIPFQYFGPYGTFCKYLVDNHADLLYKGWWAAFVVHVFEAIVALRVCRNKGITNTTTRCLWVFQTFLFGFASLGLLLKFDPERPKQH
ncbi:transmembrane protein 254 [Cheilinus undulatus]|uniref:transmembrane protein 254 n=1 Tax=Cheilinus undulatus TaxID=241271 RepID=UPI001BD5A6A6|nr:transmembrane protein 254 [Cheilinus undulatus]